MKIIKIVAILFVLFNYSMFVSLSTNSYSTNLVKNQENSALYEKLFSKAKTSTNIKSTIQSDSTSKNAVIIFINLKY